MEGLLVLVGLVGLVAMALLAWRWHRRRQLADIIAACDELRARWASLDAETGAAIAEVESVGGDLAGDANLALTELAGELREQQARVGSSVGDLPTSASGGGSPAAAESARARAASMMGRLEKTGSEARTEVAGMRRRLAALAGKRSDGVEHFAEARATAASIADRGWRVEAVVGDLDRFEDELRSVDIEPPIDLVAVERQLDRLTAQATTLTAEAEAIPEQHRSLLARAAESTSAIEELRADGLWLDNQLEAWALIHHPTSLVSVSEHPQAITGRLDEADAILTTAAADGGQLAMETQDLRGAAEGIDRATTLVEQAEALVDEARRLNVELATAAVEAESRVETAGSAVDRLRNYIDAHDYDLEARFAEPAAELIDRLTEAQRKLELDPPDSLGAMRAAEQIITDTEARSAEAEAEVKRMNQLRGRAADAIRRARAAVADLDSYTDGFFADLFGSSRRSAVDRLRRRLAGAERLNEKSVNKPDRARSDADSVAREARELLTEYKRRDEEERRRRMDD